MKAIIFTVFVMSIIVFGSPIAEKIVVNNGWTAFALMIIFLLWLLISCPLISYRLLRYNVYNNSYKWYCVATIILGAIRAIYMVWLEYNPADCDLGIATGVALTIFIVLFSFGMFMQNFPTIESQQRVIYDDLARKRKRK